MCISVVFLKAAGKDELGFASGINKNFEAIKDQFVSNQFFHNKERVSLFVRAVKIFVDFLLILCIIYCRLMKSVSRAWENINYNWNAAPLYFGR